MVGILIDGENRVVTSLRESLDREQMAAELRLVQHSDGHGYERPSRLFSAATFDTEHRRQSNVASAHGTIRVAHLVWAFRYSLR